MDLRRRALARRAAAALALACTALVGQAPALADASLAASRGLEPAIEAARGEKCVADPAFMRRNHMDLLKHQRNETVHQGVRDAKASLKGCIACHASATTGSVAAAKTDFCVSCHSFAAVKIDCFECHASKPQVAASLSADPARAAGPLTPLVALGRSFASLPASPR
jgi:hypothetical protein